MILLLGGTSESLLVADELTRLGDQFIISVVSDYGVQLSRPHAQHVVKTNFNSQSLTQFCRQEHISVMIDATHPFARVISQLAITVAGQLKISYLRFERPNRYETTAELHMVDSTLGACEYLENHPGRVYLSTGSQTAATYVQKLGVSRLHVRALPTVRAMTLLAQAGFLPKQIDAIQGPFSKALNVDLFRHARSEIVVTKESGRRGGVAEKMAACADLKLPCVVIRRPQLHYPKVVSTINDLRKELATNEKR